MLARHLLLASLLLAPAFATAQKTVPLERCLAQFEGIQWKLPYRPYLHVYRCAGPEGFFNSAGPVVNGRRTIEFIGESTLAPSRQGIRAEAFADVQLAVFTHFDKLFQRHGFQRVELKESDDDGPRFPKQASWRRFTGRGPVTLTWQGEAANTWRVTLEGAAR